MLSLDSKIRLIEDATQKEVVRFPDGLKNGAQFTEEYSIYKEAFLEKGIRIREDEQHHSFLNGKQVVHLNDPEFGQTFYHLYSKRVFKSGYSWVPV